MKIKILESGKQDLLEGYAFYEKQKAGLGDYFINSIFSDIDSLHLYAGIHQKFSGFYRILSKRFPYAIYYKLKKDEAVIYGILDCRQNPVKIEEKLNH